MQTRRLVDIFSDGQPRPLSIKELASWLEAKNGCRLFLPPIQRSIVWTNEQVINYWDSLLRGYPAGMMIVHRVVPGDDDASRIGYDEYGATHDTDEHDYQLFDGQQRMSAILLGLGRGQMKNGRKLWVDFGEDPSKISGLKFQLRISSTGQPFGYMPDAPGQKIPLAKRHAKWENWRTKHGETASPQEAFQIVVGEDLIDQISAFSFAEIYTNLSKNKREQTIQEYSAKSGAPERVAAFITALESALESSVIVQQVDAEIVSNAEEYIRLFRRIGQGGTRLSNDELTYSIIKYQYPKVREKMTAIVQGVSGRLAGEVDIVIATLRTAKIIAPWDGAKESDILSRPDPGFVSKLKLKEMVITKSTFLEMFESPIKCVTTKEAPLETTLVEIRNALSFESEANSNGLPAMLLSRLPNELIDVLVLFAFKRGANKKWPEEERSVLCAFVLHWLLFVRNSAKAAWYALEHAKSEGWCFTEDSIRELIRKLTHEKAAYLLPRGEVISKLRTAIESEGDYLLRKWEARFKDADGIGDRPRPGEALRVLSTNNQLAKNALMWLQRGYIEKSFPHYDPTSERDEDLPVDLDHIIPSSIFAFHWSAALDRFQGDAKFDKNIRDNFHEQRNLVGNSLGNYRWLDARKNRERQDGIFEPLPEKADMVENPTSWNDLINAGDSTNNIPPWTIESISKFQRLIDLRTLDLYEKILTDSGIEKIAS